MSSSCRNEATGSYNRPGALPGMPQYEGGNWRPQPDEYEATKNDEDEDEEQEQHGKDDRDADHEEAKLCHCSQRCLRKSVMRSVTASISRTAGVRWNTLVRLRRQAPGASGSPQR